MGRRYEAEALYEDEYEPEERTRAAVSPMPSSHSVPSYDDQFEDRTRSARESYVALEGLARSAERARAAFVAPAEIEGERSPAMRARRSYVDPSELLETPVRPSFVAPEELRSERRARIPRSERPGPPPAPPTPRDGRRSSFVASSERNDFASSAVDADEVTSFRPQSSHPVSQRRSRRPSQHPVSMPPVSMQQPVRESTFAPSIPSSEIEEVRPVTRASAPPAEERSRPMDYDQLKSFLFDDVPADSAAARLSREDRSVSMQTPVAPLAPRSTNKAFRPAMHSIRPDGTPASVARPEIHPAARISHHAFRPMMVTGPELPAAHVEHPHVPTAPSAMAPMSPVMMSTQQSVAPAARSSHAAFRPPMMTGPVQPQFTAPMASNPHHGPAQHDSYVDSSWIVPTPPYPSNAPAAMRDAGSFKVTLSFVAAAVTAVAALAVMIGAIIFIRSEEAPNPSAALSAPAFAAPPAPSTPTELAPAKAAAPVVVMADSTLTPTSAPAPAPTPAPAPVVVKPVVEKAASATATATAEAPKKKKAVAKVAVANSDDEDDAPPPPKKKQPAKAADKDVERMLAELGEEQLKR